uniref:uncharacterized protein LOC120328497 n=1 Tax=Styela clava TaxID=7725 RepID=UPI0019395BE8|nr:uncharacterized protein LOC120328497 [Styela clava]
MEKNIRRDCLGHNYNGYLIDQGIKTGVAVAPTKTVRFVVYTLVFCVVSTAVTTCVVVYLGIENSKREMECRQLQQNLDFLKQRLPVAEDGIITKSMSKSTVSLSVPNRSNERTSQQTFKTNKRRKSPKRNTRKKLSKMKFNIWSEDSSGSIASDVRRCLARIQNLEEHQTELKNSQRFLREQMERRLANVENLVHKKNKNKKRLPAFSSILSGRLTLESHEIRNYDLTRLLHFDHVLMNEGSGYDNSSGQFVCPLKGMYIFHLLVTVTNENTVSDKTVPMSKCTISIENNGVGVIQSKADNVRKSNFIGYETINLILVKRINKDDVVQTSVKGDCIGMKNSYFQGYYLRQ